VTLRTHMHALEGRDHAEWAIGHGFSAWAVERLTGHPDHRVRQSAMVFAKSRSDALRKADSPARLGEGCQSDETTAVRVLSEWDDPYGR
jgi:hypothetical protein